MSENRKTYKTCRFLLNLSPKMSEKRQNHTFPSRRVANWKIAIWKKAFPANTSIKKWENRSILIAPERPRAIWCYVLNENLSIFIIRVNGILRFSKFRLFRKKVRKVSRTWGIVINRAAQKGAAQEPFAYNSCRFFLAERTKLKKPYNSCRFQSISVMAKT